MSASVGCHRGMSKLVLHNMLSFQKVSEFSLVTGVVPWALFLFFRKMCVFFVKGVHSGHVYITSSSCKEIPEIIKSGNHWPSGISSISLCSRLNSIHNLSQIHLFRPIKLINAGSVVGERGAYGFSYAFSMDWCIHKVRTLPHQIRIRTLSNYGTLC